MFTEEETKAPAESKRLTDLNWTFGVDYLDQATARLACVYGHQVTEGVIPNNN